MTIDEFLESPLPTDTERTMIRALQQGRYMTAEDLYHLTTLKTTSSVTSALCNLRKKMMENGVDSAIRSKRGVGYFITAAQTYLEEELETVDPTPYRPLHTGDPLLDALRRHHPEMA